MNLTRARPRTHTAFYDERKRPGSDTTLIGEAGLWSSATDVHEHCVTLCSPTSPVINVRVTVTHAPPVILNVKKSPIMEKLSVIFPVAMRHFYLN